MKITIDTKEDSHEDIRKIVALLSQMLTTESQPQNLLDNSTSSELPNLMSIFDSSSQTQAQQNQDTVTQEQPPQAPRPPKVELY